MLGVDDDRKAPTFPHCRHARSAPRSAGRGPRRRFIGKRGWQGLLRDLRVSALRDQPLRPETVLRGGRKVRARYPMTRETPARTDIAQASREPLTATDLVANLSALTPQTRNALVDLRPLVAKLGVAVEPDGSAEV